MTDYYIEDTNVGIAIKNPPNILSVSPIQYNTGTASQSGTTVTGADTTWTDAMIGGEFVYSDGTSSGKITARASNTSLTVTTSQTVNSQAYSIHYQGLQVKSDGNVGIGTTDPISTLDVTGTLGCGAISSTGDMTIYDDQNNADTSLSIGTSATEALVIQVLNGGSNKTAEEIKFTSKTASSTANHGKMTFSVDESNKLEINDSGIEVAGSAVGDGAVIANAKIGVWTDANYAMFSHKDTAGGSNYALIQKNDGSTHLNAASGKSLDFRINNSPKMKISSTGNVGIGSSTTFNLDVRGNDFYWTTSGFRYFGGGNTSLTTTTTLNTKIYTNGDIVAAGNLGAVSDSRIKKAIVEIPDDEALVKLRLLKPCKYKYKDVIQRGDEEVYGFIAQEVKETMPYAVKILPSKEHIPNVYQGGTYTDGIITFTDPHGLTENGDSIKLLVTTEVTEIYCPFTIIDTKTIEIDTSNLESNKASMLSNNPLYDDDGNQLDYNIFVYGVEVEDFHTLRKDAIWSTGIAALQEVDRQLQAEKAKTATLETDLTAEKAKTATLENKVSTLETQMADLLARVTALENA